MTTHATKGPTDLTKQILFAVFAAALSFIITWTAIASTLPNRDEVLDMIQSTSPYNEDRKLLLTTMTATNTKLDQIALQIEAVKVEQARIAGQLEQSKQDVMRQGSDIDKRNHAAK